MNLGDPFSFLCTANQAIESCSVKFEFIGKKSHSFRVRVGARKDAFSYFGRGFGKGDCGIRYRKSTLDMQGNVSCRVGFPDTDLELNEWTHLIVGFPPNEVYLQASRKKFTFKEHEEMSFLCTSDGAEVAPPNISLFLGIRRLIFVQSINQTVITFELKNGYKHKMRRFNGTERKLITIKILIAY